MHLEGSIRKKVHNLSQNYQYSQLTATDRHEIRVMRTHLVI